MERNAGAPTIDQMLAGLGPAIFSHIRTPFGIIDRDRRIVWINRAMAAIHRCEQERAAGKVCSRVLRGCSHLCGGGCPLKGAIANGRTRVAECRVDLPGGEQRWGEVHAYPVRNGKKEVSAVIVIAFETTARRQALQKQKEYARLLEERLNGREAGWRTVDAGGGAALSVKLSRRETDVLRLITEGYTNIQIAELLAVSANTVKSYVNSLFNKLGVNDRTQAAVLAVRNRIV